MRLVGAVVQRHQTFLGGVRDDRRSNPTTKFEEARLCWTWLPQGIQATYVRWQ